MIEPEKLNETTTDLFEQSLSELPEKCYLLRLYIAGTTMQSLNALQNIKRICEEHLKGRYELEVIDIYQETELMIEENIIAVPTLLKKLPLPLQTLIGNLSDTEKVLIGLDLLPKNI
ncbi:circadian clock KaiB family protein [Geminocystis sp. NIES-3709]|uniref:circadian clock KaiB family protein n=1 Tax=Geminocystis sp. NIES-3709 TaxID=1617448 RepID=UPI0005FC856E|nr:circadian clock KaiB family protein [Geminocystis sp. NIES-3709]BAQ66655.1 circadian oscillation regulator KaiB [Geminocystis sp. NIES-3709]